MMRFLRQLASMRLTALRVPVHRMLALRGRVVPALLLLALSLALGNGHLSRVAFAGAAAQWDISGPWTTTQPSSGYTVTFSFTQNGQNVSATVTATGPSTLQGNFQGTMMGNVLAGTVSWTGDGTCQYQATITAGQLNGTTSGCGAPDTWTGTGPTASLAAPTTIMLWTEDQNGVRNKPNWNQGEPFKTCFYQPSIGATVLVDVLPDNTRIDPYYQYGGGTGSQCYPDNVGTTSAGQECMYMTFTDVVSGNVSMAHQCWHDNYP